MKTYAVSLEKRNQNNNGFFIVSGENEEDALNYLKNNLCEECSLYNKGKINYYIREITGVDFQLKKHIFSGKCTCTVCIDDEKNYQSLSVKLNNGSEGLLF